MTNTKKSKLNAWILAAAALMAPAIMSARTQAQPSHELTTEEQAEAADIVSSPEGVCPFACNSSAQCTTGCHTEALCMQHHCIAL